tara:strand:- start:237 stop:443 length:207 start_codon:yes stop_codon:yes gene_type:complete
VVFQLLLEVFGLIEDFLFGRLLNFDEGLCVGPAGSASSPRVAHGQPQELLVQEVLNPRLPLEEGYVHF